MLLEVKDLSVYYEKAQAVKDLTIDVKEGEIVTIIGANGAGKSTTLRAIAGLVRLASGEIWFGGHRVDRCRPDEMANRGISLCMEGRRLFSNMTVLENLEMGAFCQRDKHKVSQNLESTFDRFPVLRERQKQKAGTLSGGEQQMLTIARALMSTPKLLLLDEPSLGLAPMIVANVAEIVKELNTAGLTVLIVEQNAEMALKLAHRGYVLQVGKIIREGDTESLHSDPFVRRAYLGV